MVEHQQKAGAVWKPVLACFTTPKMRLLPGTLATSHFVQLSSLLFKTSPSSRLMVNSLYRVLSSLLLHSDFTITPSMLNNALATKGSALVM